MLNSDSQTTIANSRRALALFSTRAVREGYVSGRKALVAGIVPLGIGALFAALIGFGRLM